MTIINLDGVVGWDIDAKEFAEQLDMLSGDITFELNSGGGYITDGVSILNKIRSYERGKTIANISYAASMMTQIALACDEVNAYDNAIFMIHNAQNVVYGDHNDMRKQADMQERMSNMLAQLYVKKSGKSLEEIKEMMDNDTYLFSDEIVSMGFADSIIDTDEEKNKATAMVASKEKMNTVKKAMEKEKLTVEDMEKNFAMCESGCNLETKNTGVNLDAMPETKLAENPNKRVVMTKEQIDIMQDENKVLTANRQTLLARNENLQFDLDTKTKEVATLKDDFDAKLDKATAKLEEGFKAKAKEDSKTATKNMTARVNHAFATNVASAKTVIAMISAESDEDSSDIAIEAKEKTEAIHQGEQTHAKAGAWDNINY